MTDKSRRKRSRQSTSRKARGQQRHAAATRVSTTPPPSEAATQPQATSSPETLPPRTSVRPQTIQFPYIATELRTIGILAGIMVGVLIILYFTVV